MTLSPLPLCDPDDLVCMPFELCDEEKFTTFQLFLKSEILFSICGPKGFKMQHFFGDRT